MTHAKNLERPTRHNLSITEWLANRLVVFMDYDLIVCAP